MKTDKTSSVGVVKQSVAEFGEDDCASMAAALAYYTAFSLPPLLVLVVTAAGWIWSPEAVTGQVEREVRNVLGAGGWQQIEAMMEATGEQKRGLLAAIVGVIMLLFGATGVMVQLQAALNRAWEVEPDPEKGGLMVFLTKRLLSLGMIIAVAFLLIVSLVMTAVLSAIGDTIAARIPLGIGHWVPAATHAVVSLTVMTLLFAAMFKWLPDADVRWSDTFLGAFVTAVLFACGKIAMGLYFGMTDTGTYGAAASFVMLLIWVYYSGMIFLFGAEFTQVWAKHRGGGITPSEDAVRVIREKRRVDETQPTRETAAEQATRRLNT